MRRAAQLTRQNRLVDAWLLAEPVVLTADDQEAQEIREWLAGHIADFTGEETN